MYRSVDMKNYLVRVMVASAVLFAGAFLLPNKALADDDTNVIDRVNVDIAASCNIAAGGGGSYSETMSSNDSVTITGNNITTSCNDGAGYALYAIGSSGDSYTASTHTDLISSLGNESNIKTDGSGTYGSSWKMKLTVVSNATLDNSYGNFQNIPGSFTKVAHYGGSTTASTVTPSYQVNVSSTQPAATYAGSVTYVLVHPSSLVAGQYNIAYNANGGSGTMTGHTNVYNFEPVTLSNSTFTAPSGYEFAGWCTSNTSQHACTGGTMYQPGDAVTSLGTANSTVTLYAIWGPPSTMQEFAANNTCASMSTGSTKTVIDDRDNTSYLVGKLADGNCWMLDNLALDLADSTVLNGMTENNTNASNTTLGYLKNGGGTTSDQYATAAVSNWTSNYSYSAPLVNATDKNTTVTSYGAGSGKVGIYYNYCAASAGSYCYGNGTSQGTSSGNATEDVCPAGWHMPSGNSSGEFGILAGYYTTTAANTDSLQYNLSTPLSGYFDYGSAYNQGSYGGWWSSTRYNNSSMYYLNVYSSNVYTTYGINRYSGSSLRCVAGV